jgi:hypothetical protein
MPECPDCGQPLGVDEMEWLDVTEETGWWEE